jgi:Bifunctional DNA primase/polymerase, N-terminal/Primase C terminal 1 (PriCT-1)
MTAALWFFDHGVGVFPVIGKEPACSSWDDYVCSRAHAARLFNYGVPLGRLGVADTDNADVETWAALHLPPTSFKVRTARGWHRYYRIGGPLPKFIHRDGHTIEFRNVGQYVIGPGSVHPGDRKASILPGIIYTADAWSWRWEDLPFFPTDFLFDDRPSTTSTGAVYVDGFEFPDVVSAGERHDQLFRLLRSFKGLGMDQRTTREAVSLANQRRCQPPLDEDDTFERWFNRGWKNPDRPIAERLDPLQGVRGL